VPDQEFKHIKFIITAETAEMRIDKALPACSDVGTRSQASRLIALGYVFFDGQKVKASRITTLGEEYEVQVPVEIKSDLVPYEIPLDIVFEDDQLIVVNKPAGLVVHPAYGHAQDTLVNALVHHAKDLSMGFHEQRPGLVHRLDKGTSGLLVIAKNDEAQRFLAMQFQRKTTHRVYWALTAGAPKEKAGRIQSYLRRHPEDRKRVASVRSLDPEAPLGKLAITHYRVAAEHPAGVGLLQLKLETGRTHQIRVHLSEGGWPILGDETYGGMKRLKSIRSPKIRELVEASGRFALHAAELGFVHPVQHNRMIFRIGWPDDLKALVEHLGFLGVGALPDFADAASSGPPLDHLSEDEDEDDFENE